MKPSLQSVANPGPTPTEAPTFATRYCARHGIERSAYSNAVLRAVLYPHARWLRPLLSRRSLAVDRDFVESVGRLRVVGDFQDKLQDFIEDPDGRTWLREVLYLRVSAPRLHRLVRATLGRSAP